MWQIVWLCSVMQLVIRHQPSPGQDFLITVLSTCLWTSVDRTKEVTDVLLIMVLEVLQLKRPSLLYNVSGMRSWLEQVKHYFICLSMKCWQVHKHPHLIVHWYHKEKFVADRGGGLKGLKTLNFFTCIIVQPKLIENSDENNRKDLFILFSRTMFQLY